MLRIRRPDDPPDPCGCPYCESERERDDPAPSRAFARAVGVGTLAVVVAAVLGGLCRVFLWAAGR